VSANEVLFVEVKTTVKARPNYSAELDELRAFEVPEYAAKELWIHLRSQRKWVICPA